MDEGVHDVHSFLGDTDVRVYLFQYFIDVDREGLDSSSSGFSVGSGFFGFSWFLSHFEFVYKAVRMRCYFREI